MHRVRVISSLRYLPLASKSYAASQAVCATESAVASAAASDEAIRHFDISTFATRAVIGMA
jgi:hypothetical protein